MLRLRCEYHAYTRCLSVPFMLRWSCLFKIPIYLLTRCDNVTGSRDASMRTVTNKSPCTANVRKEEVTVMVTGCFCAFYALGFIFRDLGPCWTCRCMLVYHGLQESNRVRPRDSVCDRDRDRDRDRQTTTISDFFASAVKWSKRRVVGDGISSSRFDLYPKSLSWDWRVTTVTWTHWTITWQVFTFQLGNDFKRNLSSHYIHEVNKSCLSVLVN
jgi:hypothetical protein